jgi:hypothetical protein
MMDMGNLLALITALGGLLLSAVTFASLRRFRKAEATAKESEAYSLLVNALRTNAMTIDDLMNQLSDLSNMQKQLNEAQSQIQKLERDLNAERAARISAEALAQTANDKITKYLHGIYELTQQLIEKGETPRWQPDPTGPLGRAVS